MHAAPLCIVLRIIQDLDEVQCHIILRRFLKDGSSDQLALVTAADGHVILPPDVVSQVGGAGAV